uniref:Uncharacterized protein n=1 Tax=Anguilla anguilla TaxID=7936 RepID=A0A0E9UUF9_ANGAN
MARLSERNRESRTDSQ